jgi:hypothetical protein
MLSFENIWPLGVDEALVARATDSTPIIGYAKDGRILWEHTLGSGRIVTRPWPLAAGNVVSLVVRRSETDSETGGTIVAFERKSGKLVWQHEVPSAAQVHDGFGTSAADETLLVHHLEVGSSSILMAFDPARGLVWTRPLEQSDQLRRVTVHRMAVVIEGFDHTYVLDRGDGRTLRHWEVDGDGCVVDASLYLFPRTGQVERFDLISQTSTTLGPRPKGGLPAGCALRGENLVIRLFDGREEPQRFVSLSPQGKVVWRWDGGRRAERTREQALIDFAPVAQAPLSNRMPRHLPLALAGESFLGNGDDGLQTLALLDLDTGRLVRSTAVPVPGRRLRVMRDETRFVVGWGPDTVLRIDGESGRLDAVFEGIAEARLAGFGLAGGRRWWLAREGVAAVDEARAEAEAVRRAETLRQDFGKGW